MDFFFWLALVIGLILVGVLLQYFFGTRVLLKAHDKLAVIQNEYSSIVNDARSAYNRVLDVEKQITAKVSEIRKVL